MKIIKISLIIIFLFSLIFFFKNYFKEEFKIEEKVGVFEKQENILKSSIPLDEILSGGPGKDGIPSIDRPKFID
jgi:hypothetical protein